MIKYTQGPAKVGPGGVVLKGGAPMSIDLILFELEHHAREKEVDDARIAQLEAEVVRLKAAPQPDHDVTVPIENGKNRYGVDIGYFRNLINRELNRSLSDYKPDELARIFARAARTADAGVLNEPEFQSAPQPEREPDSDTQCGSLKVIGHIDLHDDDEGPQRYKHSLLIQFKDIDTLLRAFENGRCSFTGFE